MRCLVKIKALSVNNCWQGKRFKTKTYTKYEEELLYLLPKIEIPEGKLHLKIAVGLSSKQADIDNICKPFIDVLQKKYKFDDKRIYRLSVIKEDVKKGQENIEFKFEKYVHACTV